MIYIALGIFAGFFSFLRIFVRYKTEIIEFLLIFALIYLSTFRSVYVGADTFTYTNFFKYSPNIFNFDAEYLSYLEPGFRVYMALVKSVSSNVEFFLFCSSVFCIIPMYWGVKRLKLNYSLMGLTVYLFIYFIPYALNGLRQAIAMGLFILALSFFNEKKNSIIIFLSLLAFSIHSSGMFIAFSYLLFVLDYRKSLGISLFSAFFMVFFSYYGLTDYFVFNVGGVDANVYTKKFDQATSFTQYAYRVLLLLLIGFFVFFEKNITLKKIFIIYFFGFMLYFALAKNNILATRFNMFFRILEIVLVPSILFGINKTVIRFFVFIIFFVLFFWIYFVTSFLPDNIYQFQW
ncbi:EpsG family protein [Acinetobacter gerneri]|uniref:EpsG family protein n=1 Tax=Acinetobacter gerneri TaxID=202952 RepID=A0AAW8JKP9_9GAMM|nr:EpsG family protein [Acinetobacter gerneri]MDQ9010701.1 EpsG family protein [Acinetobacter gerneri]MDQ9014867.1 EpsG family protein [Acinetobacter gerneri]MDQ9026071.1 EpsG family protein [Acinetobacter gerneri]MDQ9053319.1 EpsG family protein [Acinetobacter gerneri]MDQ9060938.1 EpsG family protein [Acinetobacter gerneri]